MDIPICGGKTLTLHDGTVATFADKAGNIIDMLTVSGDCWSEQLDARANFDPDTEAHIEYETTTMDVPATCATKQIRKVQTMKTCRDKAGNPVKCPPR